RRRVVGHEGRGDEGSPRLKNGEQKCRVGALAIPVVEQLTGRRVVYDPVIRVGSGGRAGRGIEPRVTRGKVAAGTQRRQRVAVEMDHVRARREIGDAVAVPVDDEMIYPSAASERVLARVAAERVVAIASVKRIVAVA